MIDMKISICFHLINLTEFPWHELQDTAQRFADQYTFHGLPETFELQVKQECLFNGVPLAVFVCRKKDVLEFLFVQPNILIQEVGRADDISLAG